MATTYSELITSFERAGKFPLEADYIFGTEDDLKGWLSDEMHLATLHEGLLKVVLKDPNGLQGLYWVVQNESGSLAFTELVSTASAEEMQRVLAEITKYAEAIDALNEAVRELGEATLSGDDSLKAQIRAIVGCGDGEDVMDVLESLTHGDLKAISEWIDTVDPEGMVDGLWGRIEGDPLPSSDFQTLRGVEDTFTKASVANAYAHGEMIREIDRVETGVGLNADGSYSPDPTTNYLTDATSVMHALRILDDLIKSYSALGVVDGWYDPDTEEIVLVVGTADGEKEIRIPVADLITEWEPENADSSPVVLTRERHEGGAPDTLSAGLKVSADEGNAVEVRGDGVYVGGTDLEWINLNDD